MEVKTFGVIGAGQMAEAIIRASLSNGALHADAISLEDIDSARVEHLYAHYRLSGNGDVSEASLLVLGIRPQDDLAAVENAGGIHPAHSKRMPRGLRPARAKRTS